MRIKKTHIAGMILTGLALIAQDASAGPYVRFSVGAIAGNYVSGTCRTNGGFTYQANKRIVTGVQIDCIDGPFLGDSGYLGTYEIGYRKHWKLAKNLNMNAQGYVFHISDPKIGHDGGLDAGMIGLEFEYTGF